MRRKWHLWEEGEDDPDNKNGDNKENEGNGGDHEVTAINGSQMEKEMVCGGGSADKEKVTKSERFHPCYPISIPSLLSGNFISDDNISWWIS